MAPCAGADVLHAKYMQGALHAYLLIRSEDGKLIGTGDEINEPVGNAWRTRLSLHFNDGSVDEETTMYVQHTTMHILTDHHVQKGPSFPKPMDMLIDVAKKQVTWHNMHDGKDEVKVEHMDLPADLANGMLPWVMQNYPKGAEELKVGYVVSTPKPRLVKFAVYPDGEDSFRIGGGKRMAKKYRIHVELGGVVGVVAPLVGKQPPDLHLWVVMDGVPTFLKMQAFLYEDGPILNMELTSPAWGNN